MCNMFNPLCVISHDPFTPVNLYRLSIIRGSRVLRHWQRFFFFSFTLFAQLHAVLLNGLCLFHISSFFFLHKHSRYWMNGDRSALCSVPPSRRRIKTPQLTFNIQFLKKIIINKHNKTAQRWANLIITIIIPTIPQEWKYNTSKHISSTGTAKDMWLYWKL